MKTILLSLAIFFGQMNTLQDKPIIHLRPRQNIIQPEFGGHLVELINPPEFVQLPKVPPAVDARGKQWSIDVKNLGPGTATIVGNSQFSIEVKSGRTVSIQSNGSGYSAVH